MTNGYLPPPSVIMAGVNSCYRAGWPTPDELVANLKQHEGENKKDFISRAAETGKVHQDRMSEIVVWSLSEYGDLQQVFRMGKLAKRDFTQALYILGFSEER